MKNIDMKMHVQGKSQYVDDLPAREGLLHSVIFGSPVAKGKIIKVDISKAELAEGVVKVLTYKDIPGKNQIGHIIQDQPLLAENSVKFIGQPVALVVAKTRSQAFNALKLIELDLEEEKPIVDPREAYSKNEIFGSPMEMTLGNTESAWGKCENIIEGRVESAGQEHFYFETQSALAEPIEGGNIKVSCSAQAPAGYQHHVSDVLGIPMHKVEIEIRRLGGGFGGKEGCAVWACLPSVASYVLDKPVKLVLSRHEDITTSGKRHPYSSDYKIGFDKNGKILAYEVTMYQNGGAFSDISLPVLGRSILHTVNSYKIPNFNGKAISCRTNITPNTAFRGFGVPQAVFLMESAIYNSAFKMGVNPASIQKANLLDEGDQLPYKMRVEYCNSKRCWNTLDEKYNIDSRIEAVKEYNKINSETKKGIYVTPICFGISFVQTALNQAGSLVHIYTDGSVGVSTGAVEMGQGVNMKILLVAAKTLSINPDRVKVEPTNSTRIVNASPTSASTGADLNGMATFKACNVLFERLTKYAAEHLNVEDVETVKIKDEVIYVDGRKTEYSWKQLIKDAYWSRVDLSCHEFYAPPQLYWNAEKMEGQPYTYHSYGTSITEVTLDCIRGTYEIDSIEVVHDIGQSISEDIDLGQFEGGIIQGLGWSTMENLVYAENGRCMSVTNAYKMPDIKYIPKKLTIDFLENVKNPYAVCNSKAVGEPPFIHGIGAYFALMDAARAARQDNKEPIFDLPMTPEKAFMYIYE